MDPKLKLGIKLGALIAVLILAVVCNPFSYNEAGYRTVVTKAGGKQFVQYEAGFYYQGFFSKAQEWPNRIIVSYLDTGASPLNPVTDENKVEIGLITGMFNDGPTAKFRGVAQFNLPVDFEKMIEINNDHKTPENLISARLSTYLIEALNSSCQLLNSEAHYSGGRAQMSQDYLDQMRNGIYIVRTTDNVVYDSIERTNKRIYANEIVRDKDGVYIRKNSSIKAYGISVSDASIAGVEYSNQLIQRLKTKVDAATDASIAKQELMTAEQRMLTAEAQGKQKLVVIEYEQKQQQTIEVVQAQTLVELAKQDLIKQDIALQAAQKEAQKIKTLADASAYEKQRLIQADGALEQKLKAYITVQGYWANAFKDYSGNIVPMFMTGGGNGGNGATNFMDVMSAKLLRDLSLEMKTK